MQVGWPVAAVHAPLQIASVCHWPAEHCTTAGGTFWQAVAPSDHGGHFWPAVATDTSQVTATAVSAQPPKPSQGTEAHVLLMQASTARDDSQAI
jgi:hypothetical protein